MARGAGHITVPSQGGSSIALDEKRRVVRSSVERPMVGQERKTKKLSDPKKKHKGHAFGDRQDHG